MRAFDVKSDVGTRAAGHSFDAEALLPCMGNKSLKRHEFIARIDQRLEVLKMSDRQASIAAVGNPDLIRNIRRGRTNLPKTPALHSLAAVLKCDPDWLFGKEGSTGPKLSTDSQPSEPIRVPDAPVSRYDSAWVAEVEARAGMGGGGESVFQAVADMGDIPEGAADAVRDHWGIPHSFLSGALRMRGERARIIEVYGDSMYDPANPNAPGSLFPGDRVIVDIFDRNPTMPGPFVIWDDGLMVKLVEKVMNSDPVRLRIMSRNPTYRPDEMPADHVRIIGRVRGRISAL